MKTHRTLDQLLGLALCICAMAFSLHQQVHAQERRVALVIGNAAYKTSPLANPVIDAQAMTARLKQLGFEVLAYENLTRDAFAKAVRDYGERLKGANTGLFYFAGHGIQARGRNFLVPVDADIQHEDEVPYRSFDMTEVLDKMDTARTAVNLVILDACRNNPFAKSFKLSQAGLAQIDAPTGTLIAFATAPGSVAQDGQGSNGLYTGALLKHLADPNLAVEQMFKRVRVDVVAASKNQQVPWESSSLNRDFSFVVKASSGLSFSASSSDPSSDFTLELAFWNEVKNSRDAADYRAYLEQYPSGRFAALARLRASASAPVALQAPPVVVFQPVAPIQASIQPPTQSQSMVNLSTPEGLYSVSAVAGNLQWRDTQKGAVMHSSPTYDAASSTPKQLQFSNDGRWLLLSLLSGTGLTHQLIDVASEKTVWERTAVEAKFDASAPQVLLQLAQGQFEAVRLP